MASVAIVTTEHDEAGPGPAKLPQEPRSFARKYLVICKVVGDRRLGLPRFLGYCIMRFLGFCVGRVLGYCAEYA